MGRTKRYTILGGDHGENCVRDALRKPGDSGRS